MNDQLLDGDGETQQQIVITFSISNPDLAENVIRILAHMEDSVELKQITEDLSTVVGIDMCVLTPLQRETLVFAIENGYYDEPRETDLEELSDALGVSKSAVSQRLRTAERKLITQISQGLPLETIGN